MIDVRQFLQMVIQVSRTAFRFGSVRPHSHRDSESDFQSSKSSGYKSGKDNKIFKRQLEGITATDNSIVLLPHKKFLMASNKNWWGRGKTSRQTRSGNSREGGKLAMPTHTQILSAGHYIQFSYHFQKKVIFGSNHIRFYVESDKPINSYIVDATGYQNFLSGIKPHSFGGFVGATIHRQDFLAPNEAGDWYLILENQGTEPVAVHYEVY